jgi:hypothetical protein
VDRLHSFVSPKSLLDIKAIQWMGLFLGQTTASCGCSEEASCTGKPAPRGLAQRIRNPEQVMTLAMSIDPRTSPFQPCNLSVLLTFIMSKDT